jgi:hypothetical protein
MDSMALGESRTQQRSLHETSIAHRSDSGWLSFRRARHQSLEKRIVVHLGVHGLFSRPTITIKMTRKQDDRWALVVDDPFE